MAFDTLDPGLEQRRQELLKQSRDAQVRAFEAEYRRVTGEGFGGDENARETAATNWLRGSGFLRTFETPQQREERLGAEGEGASARQIQELAREQGLKETKAASVIERFRQNPKAEEFRALSEPQRQSLQKAAGPEPRIKPPPNSVEIGIKEGGRQYVSKDDFNLIKNESPRLAKILQQEGYHSYVKAVKDTNATKKAAIVRANDNISRTIEFYSKYTPEELMPASGILPAKYRSWTAEELLNGKVVDGVYTPSPWGVKAGTYIPYPKEAEAKIIKAQEKAIDDLKPYLVKGTKQEVITLLKQGRKGEAVKAAAAIGKDMIDIEAALSAGKRSQLKTLGVSDKTINQAVRNSADAAIQRSLQGKPGPRDSIILGEEMAKDPRTVRIEKTAQNTIGRIAMAAMPFLQTGIDFNDFKENGYTAGEIGWLALDVATDALFLLGIAGATRAGAIAIEDLSRLARLKGALRGAGSFVIADIESPFRMLRHPAETTKSILKTVETLVRPSKLPLSAAEVSFSTIRLPVEAFEGEKQAMNIRDIAALAAMKEGKFAIKSGDIEVKLPGSVMQYLSDGMAVHSAPDIRPFLEGVTIKAGREGGLYVAANVHSRFTIASAFGDMAEGQVRGALLIRDDAILKQLGGSGKIYNNTAEIEAILKAGFELPKPSQILFTRAARADVSAMLKEAKALRVEGKIKEAADLEKKARILKQSGDKVALLVYGKPFTRAEIAQMKIAGSLDTIRQIFEPPAALTVKGERIASRYDELNGVRRDINALIEEAGRLKRAGKLTEARQIERQADELIARAGRIARELSRPEGALAGALRSVRISLNDRTALSRLSNIITRSASRARTQARGIMEPRSRITRAEARSEPVVIRDSRGRIINTGSTGRLSGEREDFRGRAGIARSDLPGTRTRITRAETARRETAALRGERAARGAITPARGQQLARSDEPITKNASFSGTGGTTRSNIITVINKARKTGAPPPGRFDSMGDKEKRAIIKSAAGAFAWRQGELHGEPVYWGKVHPYGDNDVFYVIGKPPAGAIIVKGEDSARKSIKQLYGKGPTEPEAIKIGATVATVIKPSAREGKRLRLTFSRLTGRRKPRLSAAIKRPGLVNLSRKRGRLYKSRIGGSDVISRQPMYGVRI